MPQSHDDLDLRDAIRFIESIKRIDSGIKWRIKSMEVGSGTLEILEKYGRSIGVDLDSGELRCCGILITLQRSERVENATSLV